VVIKIVSHSLSSESKENFLDLSYCFQLNKLLLFVQGLSSLYSLIILEQNVRSYLFAFLYYSEMYCRLFCGMVLPVKTAKLISAYV